MQQVDTPLEVYRRPANRFVATFIGSPAMNLFEGHLQGGRFAAPGLGIEWPFDGAPDGPAVLGVRPEDLTLAEGSAPVFTRGRLSTVERLGHETLAHYHLGQDHSTHCIARLGAEHDGSLTDEAPLTIRPEGLHLFAGDEAAVRLN